ncbi:MAG TPA: aminopeptidase P family protein [Clostridia bacterium]|nr:aminopeptidase P family protein [Clostridia bacterium]
MDYSHVPAEELARRTAGLQEQLGRAGLDGALIVENTSLYYFSGTVPNGCLYIPQAGEPLLLVRKDLNRARRESALTQVLSLDSLRSLGAVLKAYGHRPQRLGMELDVLPAKDYFRYQKILGPEVAIEDASHLTRLVRSVKSDYEIALVKKSGLVHGEVFAAIPGLIQEGMTDLALAAKFEYEARRRGHYGFTRFRGLNMELFIGQVLVGPEAAVPTCYDTPLGGQGLSPLYPQGPCGAVITPGKVISVDSMGNYTGYMVDQTRMYCLGKPPSELAKAFQVALEVQHMVEERAKPGANGAEIYEEALGIAARAGLAEHFMGYGKPVTFIGHGVGLEVNEWPVIAKGVEVPLAEGHVFALEPKFVFPGVGVAGIENTYLVTATGVEKLTVTPDEMQIL